jgi:hypothetical protein
LEVVDRPTPRDRIGRGKVSPSPPHIYAKKEDRDANEGDHSGDGGGIAGADGSADDGDEELAGKHSQGAIYQKRAATEAFNGPKGDRGRENVYECGDERDQEQVLDRTKLDEEAGTELVDDRPGKLNFIRP